MTRSPVLRSTAARAMLPRLSAGFHWIRTPLGSLGLAALVSALCGVFLHPQGFVVCGGVLGVLAIGACWPWLSVCGLSGVLAFDRVRCREGETVALQLRLRNRMPWGVWGVSVREEPGGRDGSALGALAFVSGWRTTVETAAFIPPCRGVYPSRSARLGCGFPFGLWRATRPLTVAAPMVVWPRTFPVAPLPAAEGGLASDRLALRDRAGHWGDAIGVRPYRRGDSLRRVHWGQTARHGELIVCEVQSNAVPRVQVVLDTYPSAHAGDGPNGSREWAIRVAASLAEGWVGQGAEAAVSGLRGGVGPRGRRPARGRRRDRAVAGRDRAGRARADVGRDRAERSRGARGRGRRRARGQRERAPAVGRLHRERGVPGDRSAQSLRRLQRVVRRAVQADKAR